MGPADYRMMSEATGQRIAAALEALSGFGAYLTTADVVDNLTSTATDKPGSANMLKTLNEKIITRNTILYDEAIWSASKSYSIDAKIAVLVLARCNASNVDTSPSITITGSTQTAKNKGTVGGSVMCYMVYWTGNVSENITVTFENYTSGGSFNQYGRVTIIRLYTYS